MAPPPGPVPHSPAVSMQSVGPSSIPMGGAPPPPPPGAVPYPMSPAMMPIGMIPVPMGGYPGPGHHNGATGYGGPAPPGQIPVMMLGGGGGGSRAIPIQHPSQVAGAGLGGPGGGSQGGAGFYPSSGQGGPGTAQATAGAAGSAPALPLSTRFPPLPARPAAVPPLHDPSETDEEETPTATTSEPQEASTSSAAPGAVTVEALQAQVQQLRAAVQTYEARDEAWALRMDAIGFEPARAYVAAVLDTQASSSALAATVQEDGRDEVLTPKIEQQEQKQHATPPPSSGASSSEDALRASAARRGFAPVLGMRLLQRVHKLEKENAELHDLLVRRLKLDEDGASSAAAAAGAASEQGADVAIQEDAVPSSGAASATSGVAADGVDPAARSREERAKAQATIELLETELQDAHALIAALSGALKTAESKLPSA